MVDGSSASSGHGSDAAIVPGPDGMPSKKKETGVSSASAKS
jgi:hypothetical protein